jgi:hypothetical protein
MSGLTWAGVLVNTIQDTSGTMIAPFIFHLMPLQWLIVRSCSTFPRSLKCRTDLT